mmetsp:Transcript_6746/g.14723  ORF Transcript_6746/g.14723 Transcript_6746/m.14723 type:complete len:235 (-) Transcript_6746:297-1001(-)
MNHTDTESNRRPHAHISSGEDASRDKRNARPPSAGARTRPAQSHGCGRLDEGLDADGARLGAEALRLAAHVGGGAAREAMLARQLLAVTDGVDLRLQPRHVGEQPGRREPTRGREQLGRRRGGLGRRGRAIGVHHLVEQRIVPMDELQLAITHTLILARFKEQLSELLLEQALVHIILEPDVLPLEQQHHHVVAHQRLPRLARVLPPSCLHRRIHRRLGLRALWLTCRLQVRRE